MHELLLECHGVERRDYESLNSGDPESWALARARTFAKTGKENLQFSGNFDGTTRLVNFCTKAPLPHPPRRGEINQ